MAGEPGRRDNGHPLMHGRSPAQDLRELVYELLRTIEHELGDVDAAHDAFIADTVAKCEQALADIKAQLQSKN